MNADFREKNERNDLEKKMKGLMQINFLTEGIEKNTILQKEAALSTHFTLKGLLRPLPFLVEEGQKEKILFTQGL